MGKNKKRQKEAIICITLIAIIICSALPLWLFQKAGKSIHATFDWENSPFINFGEDFWIDEPLVNYEVELWKNGVFTGITAITDANGEVSFYADDLTSIYQLKIGTNSFDVVNIDGDMDNWDLVDGEIGTMAKGIEFRFDTPSQALVIEQDIDMLVSYDGGITWEYLATFTTSDLGTCSLYFIGGMYAINPDNMTFTLHLSSVDIPYVLYVEPIAMLISSILIIVMIIWKWKSQIINKSIKKFTKNKTIRRYGDTDNYRKENTLNLKI